MFTFSNAFERSKLMIHNGMFAANVFRKNKFAVNKCSSILFVFENHVALLVVSLLRYIPSQPTWGRRKFVQQTQASNGTKVWGKFRTSRFWKHAKDCCLPWCRDLGMTKYIQQGFQITFRRLFQQFGNLCSSLVWLQPSARSYSTALPSTAACPSACRKFSKDVFQHVCKVVRMVVPQHGDLLAATLFSSSSTTTSCSNTNVKMQFSMSVILEVLWNISSSAMTLMLSYTKHPQVQKQQTSRWWQKTVVTWNRVRPFTTRAPPFAHDPPPCLSVPSQPSRGRSGLTPSLPQAHLETGQYKDSLCLEAAQ